MGSDLEQARSTIRDLEGLILDLQTQLAAALADKEKAEANSTIMVRSETGAELRLNAEQVLRFKDVECKQLEARLAALGEALKDAIDELAASGYCYDHPSLVKKRAALHPDVLALIQAAQQGREDTALLDAPTDFWEVRTTASDEDRWLVIVPALTPGMRIKFRGKTLREALRVAAGVEGWGA